MTACIWRMSNLPDSKSLVAYGLSPLTIIEEAVHIVANRNAYHPVRDFLNSLEWGGQERIRYALHRYLGADTNDYTYEIEFLISHLLQVLKNSSVTVGF